jgi:UDP-2-acetamido-2,6-beta-L-arabino-hexul-4-ose reductase
MTIAITGAHGFLGWHLSCRLLATRGMEAVRLGRDDFADPELVADRLADVETVIHVAGVNRADSDEALEQGNVDLATAVATGLGDRPVHVVFSNSIQADANNPYGRGKRRAAEIFADLPGTFANVLLPNLFGEHGRPDYNSFVATFAHEVTNGRQPDVTGDRQIPLLHAQTAAELLIEAAERREDAHVRPPGEPHGIGDVLDLLNEFHALYATRGDLPDVSTPFRRDLFNTYRAALWPHGYPIAMVRHSDKRGDLLETSRSHGGVSQSYVSSTKAGKVRGEHYHLNKIERFIVFRGEAEIQLRRLFHSEILTFVVSGDEPMILDMPTMWVHNLRNVGEEDLITVFWSDQLLDPEKPDQYPMTVAKKG